MAREERKWNDRFLAYMNMIVNHPNYQGLPIKKKSDGSLAWIATAKSEIGEERRYISVFIVPDQFVKEKNLCVHEYSGSASKLIYVDELACYIRLDIPQ